MQHQITNDANQTSAVADERTATADECASVADERTDVGDGGRMESVAYNLL